MLTLVASMKEAFEFEHQESQPGTYGVLLFEEMWENPTHFAMEDSIHIHFKDFSGVLIN